MKTLFAVIFQICYFVLFIMVIRQKKQINASPYVVLIWGVFVLGILSNAIAMYELYVYFTTGAEVEFFLGGALVNVVVLQMCQRNSKNTR